MGFTFQANNGKEYTYSNVGQRNGFVAEKGQGNLAWSEVKGKIAGRRTARKLSNHLRDFCLEAVKSASALPFDTGNLQRSIKSRNTPTGFEIYIDDSASSGAPYQYFLEFGTKKSEKHKGFWYNKMYEVIVKTIQKETKGEIVRE